MQKMTFKEFQEDCRKWNNGNIPPLDELKKASTSKAPFNLIPVQCGVYNAKEQMFYPWGTTSCSDDKGYVDCRG